MERLQDQLQASATLSRSGTAAGFCPHYPPHGGPERTRTGQPAVRALVGDAACAPHCVGVRGKQKKRRAHPERIAAGFRAETLCASLGSEKGCACTAAMPGQTLHRINWTAHRWSGWPAAVSSWVRKRSTAKSDRFAGKRCKDSG